MLFISHSSQDDEIARALVDLIRDALPISPEEIRCTSLTEYAFRGGADIDEEIRREVDDSEAFVALISHHSLRSTYVMFELGARWGVRKPLVPLLAPGLDPLILEAPLSALRALSCGNASELQQLLEGIAKNLNRELHPASSYEAQLKRFSDFPPAPGAGVIPQRIAKELEFDFAARRERLSKDQKEVLRWLEEQSGERDSVPQRDFEVNFSGRNQCVYWLLEALSYLGFVEKHVTERFEDTPRFNYSLSPEYKRAQTETD